MGLTRDDLLIKVGGLKAQVETLENQNRNLKKILNDDEARIRELEVEVYFGEDDKTNLDKKKKELDETKIKLEEALQELERVKKEAETERERARIESERIKKKLALAERIFEEFKKRASSKT